MILALNKNLSDSFEIILKEERLVYERIEDNTFLIPRSGSDKWDDICFGLGIKYRMMVEQYLKNKEANVPIQKEKDSV